MPIQIKCQCGKSLNIPDALVGKAVKCPGCGTVIKVPAKPGSAAAAKTAPAAKPATAARSAPAASNAGLDDFFDEEGFSKQVSAVCPACRIEMAAGAVLCTKCGFHREHGTKMMAHKTAGVDIDHGTLALMKAESDMAKADEMQAKLVRGAGLPWWGLALVLFTIGSAALMGVLAVNQAKRVDGDGSINFKELFFQLVGGAFTVVAIGALCTLAFKIYKQRNATGAWRPLFVAIVCGGVAAGCFIMAGR